MTTTFRHLRTVVGDASVVVDSLADYAQPDGAVTTVVSCDIYEIADGQVGSITSYNVEVSDGSGGQDR